jgi:plastocyanin
MKSNLLLALVLFFPFNLFAQTEHIVLVRDFEFDPRDIEITLGDTVTWQWVDGIHTTTSDATSGPDSWNSIISSGLQTFSFVISNEGLHRYYCVPHGGPNGIGMAGTITAMKPASLNDEINALQTFEINQNYPNPFNPSTNITFKIGESDHVKLIVYNSLGDEIEALVDEYKNAGTYTYSFNAEDLASGVYFYKLITGNYTETRKMLLMK